MSSEHTLSQEFTASGTFNVPTGVRSVWVSMIGGGGQGGACNGARPASGSGGAGSGEYCLNVPVKVTSGGTVTVTIGTGGNNSTAGGDGDPGTDSSFGALSCKGGLGGSNSLHGASSGNG